MRAAGERGYPPGRHERMRVDHGRDCRTSHRLGTSSRRFGRQTAETQRYGHGHRRDLASHGSQLLRASGHVSAMPPASRFSLLAAPGDRIPGRDVGGAHDATAGLGGRDGRVLVAQARAPSPWWHPSGSAVTMRPVDQLGLSPFIPGDTVAWWDDRGRRTGRFVGVVTRGRHRGAAEVALGGAISVKRVVRVPLDRLSPAGSGDPDRARGSP
jgi:hypothetical protein